VAQKSTPAAERSNLALNHGRRERNFWMQRRSAKNRHSNGRTPARMIPTHATKAGIPYRYSQTRPPGTEFLVAETGPQISPPKWVSAHRDKNPGNEWSEIPAETPYLALCRKRAVCKDWMVVCAVVCEPVSAAIPHWKPRQSAVFRFLSQNGEFKSKGFRYPCVLSVGFRAMWRPATARAMWR